MGQRFITERLLIQGDNLFSRRVDTAYIYLSCTSRVRNKSTHVSQDQQYNTQGSFAFSYLFGSVYRSHMNDRFFVFHNSGLSKAISFHFKALCLFISSLRWAADDPALVFQSLFACLLHRTETSADVQGLYQRIQKQCCCFTAIFQKTAHNRLVNHYQFICHSCHMTLASSFIRNALL